MNLDDPSVPVNLAYVGRFVIGLAVLFLFFTVIGFLWHGFVAALTRGDDRICDAVDALDEYRAVSR